MKHLSDLGERAAIDILSSIFSAPNIAYGIGDDCAAIELKEDYLLITTDMISQKTHIPKEMTPYQLGWFIVAINLSDIAAKGGLPIGMVLNFGLPKNVSEGFLKQLAKGANTCATTFNTNIIGGDMKETTEINLSGTAIGQVKKDEFMPRKGIQSGDILAVTGTLGKAGAGYYSLNDKSHQKNYSKLLFEPIPKIKEARELAKLKCVTSCMDISDGLSSSLYQLQKLNNLSFEIRLENVPISEELFILQKSQKIIPAYTALHFGGDYELLVTIPHEKFQLAVDSLKKIGKKLTAIGKATKEKNITIIDKDGKKILENLGYEHFKNHIY